MQGTIFDIKEFSVHDGPGVRQTVFLKGCPMRCCWCHNPEGWEREPQLLVYASRCTHCGACRTVCPSPDACTVCGRCIPACPVRARWICGETLSPEELAARLAANAEVYAEMGGGITFSGGEPLMQPEFLFETLNRLPGIHMALETSGCAEESVFCEAMDRFSLILMDFKLADPALHLKYTGRDNAGILGNLDRLCRGKTPFQVRIPLIPGITDTDQNLRAAAELLQGAPALQCVELLPYNRLAGAKYEWLGQDYRPPFDPECPPAVREGIFRKYGIESRRRTR